MTWIATATGHEVDLRYPLDHQLDILSIAWSLSQINRFNGHACRPYSVAEHSLLVCEIIERNCIGAPNYFVAMAALLHDAHEAFCGDVATPAKRVLGEAWHRYEGTWAAFVGNAYSTRTANTAWAAVIKHADLTALATERRDLLHPRADTPWPCLQGIEPIDWVNLNAPERRVADWEFWRDRFLDKFHELEEARHQASIKLQQSAAKPAINTTQKVAAP